MKIKIINISSNPLPRYQTIGSSGMDLMAHLNSCLILKPMERKVIPTGLSIELPIGYEGQIRPRSGLAIKNGIICINGTIDSDYRGDICVLLINLSDKNFTIYPGNRIAQMVILRYEVISLIEVKIISKTKRGSRGLGSTGI